MNSKSVSLKIWDKSMTQNILDDAIQELSCHAKKSENNVVVTLSGPNTFTVSVYWDDLVEQAFQEVPC